MIEVKECTHQIELLSFIKFSFDLYKNCPYWVPPLINEELENFDKTKNPAFKYADARFFMAYKNNKAVGRVVAIINRLEVNEQQKRKMRFGWFDVIDDLKVSRALMNKVREIGLENSLEYMEGPVGFSNMDKGGLLTFGFERMNTLATWYNYPYYQAHFEQLGFEPETKWVEYTVKIPNNPFEKVARIANIVQERSKVKPYKFKNKKDALNHAEEMFDLLNETYATLSSFIPLQTDQIQYYKKKYFTYLNPEFIICVKDENNKIVAFSIMMPSLSKALKKADGKLFPFGWYHLLKAQNRSSHAEFYLIGVHPDYQKKGVTAIIFKETNDLFNRRGIVTAETNPELEENKDVRVLWKDYDEQIHKKRCTFRKNL
ncbi:MAG: GTP cyclohydrolase [Flavobacteriaceae bacterium]|nr:GTP cyclohydrolase [Flavobacteriaceae bacterium]